MYQFRVKSSDMYSVQSSNGESTNSHINYISAWITVSVYFLSQFIVYFLWKIWIFLIALKGFLTSSLICSIWVQIEFYPKIPDCHFDLLGQGAWPRSYTVCDSITSYAGHFSTISFCFDLYCLEVQCGACPGTFEITQLSHWLMLNEVRLKQFCRRQIQTEKTFLTPWIELNNSWNSITNCLSETFDFRIKFSCFFVLCVCIHDDQFWQHICIS